MRFGSLERLKTLLDQGAEPAAAMVDVAEGLAQRRGGDAESAFWACAVLGYAADLVPADLIPGDGIRRSSLLPPSHPAVSATSTPKTDSESTEAIAPFDDVNATRSPVGAAVPSVHVSEGSQPVVGDDRNDRPPALPGPADGDGSNGDERSGSRRWRTLAVAAALVVVAAVGLL